MDSAWEARGYQQDLATDPTNFIESKDPKGEAAYQRAFAKAARQNPPRVPNPEYYPNSPSAQEYIRRRNRNFFSNKGSQAIPNPAFYPPIPDIHRVKSADDRKLPIDVDNRQSGPNHSSSSHHLSNSRPTHEISKTSPADVIMSDHSFRPSPPISPPYSMSDANLNFSGPKKEIR